MQTACFRVAQEAITNAIRHARAVTVVVELQAEPNCVRLLVQDDGVEYVNSTPGRGTQIRAWFPLALPGPDIII